MTEPSPSAPSLRTPRLRLELLGPGNEARLQAVFDAAADWQTALGRPRDPAAADGEIAASAATPERGVAVMVLAESGEDVGALAWWRDRPEAGVALLGVLLVIPARRGQGLAREALGALEASLAGSGTRELRTAFPRRLLPLHGLVRALGFREMSIADHQRLGLPGAGTALWHKALA